MLLVELTLAGQSYLVLNGGQHDKFNDAISLVGRLRRSGRGRPLLVGADRGRRQARECGWLKDKYGVSWQIIPRRLADLIADPDPAKAKRAMEAMMTMVKIDVAALEAAAAGM